MTAQIPDTFLFGGDEYFLVGKRGGDLALPEQFGVTRIMTNTACYRGFYAAYELTEEVLYLRELTLGNYLPINGIEPEVEDSQFTYRGLSVLVPFTGMIRIVKDPIGGGTAQC